MNLYQIQLVLPDDVIEHLPKDSKQWVSYLASFFENGVLKAYEASLQRRQNGSVLGKPLSRYEKAAYIDLLVDMALGQLREKIDSAHETRSPAEFSERAV